MKWRRNEIKRFFAATLDRAALGVIGIGLIKPIFEPGADDGFLIVGAMLIAIAFEVFAFYLLRTLEYE